MAANDSLVVHHSVDIRDDTLISCCFDCAQKLFFRSPVGPDRSFLVKFSQIPNVVTSISRRSAYVRWDPHVVSSSVAAVSTLGLSYSADKLTRSSPWWVLRISLCSDRLCVYSRGSQQAVIPIEARRSVSDSYFFQWTPFPSAYHLFCQSANPLTLVCDLRRVIPRLTQSTASW